jgi:ATP-dependent exoDNAse (exonuclease V) alpha subunit
VFCAPTAAAADVLRKDLKSLRPAPVTIARLLTGGLHHPISSRSVLVVDEAGAVGLDDMTKLFELATQRRARVILSGDTGQHAAVARGDALRIIEEYSNYRFAELTTIRRQKPAEFRDVVKLAARKQTALAFQKLEGLGAVTEASTDDTLYDQATAAYLNAHRQGRSALLVSPTWVEIEAVTRSLREAMKAEGALGMKDRRVTAFDSLSWTLAQKKSASLYRAGHRVRFVRYIGTFAKGEVAEVMEAGGETVRLRRANGIEASVRPSRLASSVDVGQDRELQIAPGDWLLLQTNADAGRQRFINGERVQVKAFGAKGSLELTDGRILPADYRTFTHGYAVTSHSSQGRTVDEVLVVASSRSISHVPCCAVAISAT